MKRKEALRKVKLHKQEDKLFPWMCRRRTHSGRRAWSARSDRRPGCRNLWPCTCTRRRRCAWRISASEGRPDRWCLYPGGGRRIYKERGTQWKRITRSIWCLEAKAEQDFYIFCEVELRLGVSVRLTLHGDGVALFHGVGVEQGKGRRLRGVWTDMNRQGTGENSSFGSTSTVILYIINQGSAMHSRGGFPSTSSSLCFIQPQTSKAYLQFNKVKMEHSMGKELKDRL